MFPVIRIRRTFSAILRVLMARGPLPAVVVLHGCNGFSSPSVAIADDLKSLGYVALTVDSLGPRDSTGECGRFFVGQEIDAYAALAYLSQLPFVDPNRVAVLGYSMGGYPALLAVQRGAFEKRFDRKFGRLSHTTPSCHGFSAIMTVPFMILVGDADDWTPAEVCRKMVARSNGDGHHKIDLMENEAPQHTFGPHPKGYLIITQEGRLMIMITADNRKAGMGVAERAALHKTMAAASGKVRVEGKDFIISVDVSWNEAWNGTEQRRHFKIEADKLFVETAPGPSLLFPDKTSFGRLVFERDK
jgi:dienelactone hydrolase